jgi:hypothetical protein
LGGYRCGATFLQSLEIQIFLSAKRKLKIWTIKLKPLKFTILQAASLIADGEKKF